MSKLLCNLLFLLLCWRFTLTNSRTSSTFWRLEGERITAGGDDGGVVGGTSHYAANMLRMNTGDKRTAAVAAFDLDTALVTASAYDEIFRIIVTTSSAYMGWERKMPVFMQHYAAGHNESAETLATTYSHHTTATCEHNAVTPQSQQQPLPSLDCGKPVNYTYYDYLVGVGKRRDHPSVPEPEVAYLFLKSKSENALRNFDLTMLERRLRRAKRERSHSAHLYNQMGNYWRIVGDATQAIECFRRALAMAPANAEILLNLARLLFHLQYLDDAIHLTRRSLELQAPGREEWQQYFTLGQIYKAYGHFHEALMHLRRAHELHPQHEPILKALRLVEWGGTHTELHAFTLVIIVALVFLVLGFVLKTSLCVSESDLCNSCAAAAPNNATPHTVNGNNTPRESNSNARYDAMQRSLNRAMTIRTLKGFTARPNSVRQRRN